MRCEWRPPASCPRWTRVRLTRSPVASSLCCAWPCWSRCAACSTPYMPDTMLERRLLLAPMFLVAQFALAHWAAGGERPPAPPDLSRFPAGFGEWKQLREDPMAAGTAAEPRDDRRGDARYPAGRNHRQPLLGRQRQRTRRGSVLVSEATARGLWRVGGQTLAGCRLHPGQTHRYQFSACHLVGNGW